MQRTAVLVGLADGSDGDNDLCDPGDTTGVASLVYVCSSAGKMFVQRIQSMGGGKAEKRVQIHDWVASG